MRSFFSLIFCSLLAVVGVHSQRPTKVPEGFATTRDGRFAIDGKPFSFVGANSYWIPLLTKKEDVDSTFKQMQDAGVKVLRTWGFNAINGSELAGAQQSGLTYYQVWNSSEWTLNTGPQGLQRLDYVVKTAGKYGIKLILAFTNNWVGYGGSELYINWIAGANETHDVFFSDPRIIKSYQKYVTTIVNRYKDSPNIFAWELMNEARCLGDLPGGPNCVPGTELLNKWYKQQSDFVRKLDPYHLITTGGEGHFYWKNKNVGYWLNGQFVSDYNFNGQAGEDFDADLLLDNIDFGTYHIYPQSWYTSLDHPNSNFTIKNWGLEWIQAHADAAKKANKPVILEEFGVSGIQNKTDIYPAWVGLALKTNHAYVKSSGNSTEPTRIMPWQFGALGLKESNRVIKYADEILNGASPNDGFAIYKNQTFVWNIFTSVVRLLASFTV
ncbi:glycoside hydrolase [Panaeolus papilionaceus]|nr:glycoside hydrolase [Panaeolus papilionaceus]